MKKMFFIHQWPVLFVMAALLVILATTLFYYKGNPSALFHIDRSITDEYALPEYTVVLNGFGYDGMEYYQIARNIPKLVQRENWMTLRTIPPGPYAHQRILLPILAYLVAFGQDTGLPWTFLLINILSLLIVTWIMLQTKRKSANLFAIALALCPAAMVGLHFSLAEPLALLLISMFLFRFTRHQRIDLINILLLSGIVLTREVNILFVFGTGAYVLWQLKWKDLLLLLIPIAVFLTLHFFIWQVFHTIPFLWSAEKSTFPLYAIVELLAGFKGYTKYTLSSIALFLLFVLPAFILVVTHIVKARKIDYISWMLFAFLGLMLLMPDHIWGSITSIGRVITPVYPLYAFFALTNDNRATRAIGICMLLLGLGTAFGLSSIPHPYMFS